MQKIKTVIQVQDLSKQFRTREYYPGVRGAIRNLFFPKTGFTTAVDNISFSVKEGERVAFIGPNGAGKSTTIKMLTGILYPDSGSIQVLGHVPWKDKKVLTYLFGTVFGQRTQLMPRLSPIDTFKLLAAMYELNQTVYQRWLDELIEAFQIKAFLKKTVYQLSLGERMRCELVASLLHQPRILFLDEPTIGLDVNAKLIIRGMLNRLSIEKKMTLFLTSHDPADIEQVCERAIIIADGKVIRDSSINEWRKSYAKTKILTINMETEQFSLNLPGTKIVKLRPYHVVIEVNLEEISMMSVIQELLKKVNLKDLNIEDPPMEEILRHAYVPIHGNPHLSLNFSK